MYKWKMLHNLFWLIFFFVSVLQVQAATAAEDSVCARVKIEIRQELTLERQAFNANMRINNGLSHISLENVAVDVSFADETGNAVLASSDPNNTDALFFIRLDSMDNISSVSGSGTVAPSTSADIHWLIIPAPGSSNGLEAGTLYYVGATLRYTIGGEEQITEVSPEYIFVKPMPELTLDYFLPVDVYGDDAFTPEIEPIVPFALGIRVLNSGAGAVRNLKIDSAQPKIIENEQGLLINFAIEGSEVNGWPATASLLADFGDINPNTAGVARWIMTTSLSGKFVEFTASYTHADELGGELTSLIDAIHAHFLVHDILVDLPGRDGIRDFLAREGASTYMVYESETIDTPVQDQSAFSVLQSAGQSGLETTYNLSNPVTAGFCYIQLADPHNGQKVLKEVIRSDGKKIKRDNAWLSKTRDAQNTWHYHFNLFDANTTNAYTVIFEDAAAQPDAPILQFIPDRYGVEGQQLSFIVEASDPDGTIPLLSASPLPALASFNDRGDVNDNGIATGVFDWTPAVGQAGTYRITYTASDGLLTATRSALIVVNSVNDRDGDGLPNTLEDTTCTDPDNPDSDGDGIFDGVEDANHNGVVDPGETDPCVSNIIDDDFDGVSNDAEIAAQSDPNNVDSSPGITSLTLRKGYNQVSFPAETMFYGDLQNLMVALGGSSILKKVNVFNQALQVFNEAGYDGSGIFYGENLPLPAGQGLPGVIIYAKQEMTFQFTSKYCQKWHLQPGTNLVGTGCVPDGLTAEKVLQNLGGNTKAVSIQRFNPDTGDFETRAFDAAGNQYGINFPILSSEGYFIYMKQEIKDFRP